MLPTLEIRISHKKTPFSFLVLAFTGWVKLNWMRPSGIVCSSYNHIHLGGGGSCMSQWLWQLTQTQQSRTNTVYWERGQRIATTVLSNSLSKAKVRHWWLSFCPGQVELPSGQVNLISYLSGGQVHFLAYTHAIQYNIHIFSGRTSRSAIRTSKNFVLLVRRTSPENP